MKKSIFLPLLISLALLPGLQALAQALPQVSVRFTNPYFDCPTENYCLDVEFLAGPDNDGVQVFGMNVRFFYDDAILEFLAIGDTAQGYGILVPPKDSTFYEAESRAYFGFNGPLEWINGEIQLKDNGQPIYLSATQWTKLFNVCFHVDDPASLKIDEFCPSIVWDLQEFPSGTGFGDGYLAGDDGVVITLVTDYPDSAPTTEIVEQFNWVYQATDVSAGYPVREVCVPTTCGYIIPVSNWALFLAIGLMVLTTAFIYRRRMSS